MKGVILAGGNGTRLRPLTLITNKHLLPVYNKPMILYPLETLKSMGITDIMIVSGGDCIGDFTEFLGDGTEFGVKLTYRVQKEAGGIAQALLLAEGFVDDKFAVILGDNIFGKVPDCISNSKDDCVLVVQSVTDPERFGVYSESENFIEEKPKNPKSNLAVTGLYIYSQKVFDFIKTLKPSARGELEITDVNNWCLGYLNTGVYHYSGFWSDAGTFESLARSAEWVRNKLI